MYSRNSKGPHATVKKYPTLWIESMNTDEDCTYRSKYHPISLCQMPSEN